MQTEILVAVVVAPVLFAFTIYVDGPEVWKDLGAISLSGFSVITYYLFTAYMENRREWKRISLIILENRKTTPVFVQWGKFGDRQHGYSDYITLEPNHVISRDCLYQQSTSRNRPCVRVFQSKQNTEKNVTIILGEPLEFSHTKVYQITEGGIIESRNPTERQWHSGELNIYQTPDKT